MKYGLVLLGALVALPIPVTGGAAPPPVVTSTPQVEHGKGLVRPVLAMAQEPAPEVRAHRRGRGLVPPIKLAEHLVSVNAGAPPRAVVKNYPWMSSTVPPLTLNWETVAGVMQPAFDQGDCGDCWAGSSKQAYQISYAIQGGGLIQVSCQQILNCNGQGYTCNGGWWPYQLFAAGVGPESGDPYTGNDGSCPAGLAHTYQTSTAFYVGNQSGIVPPAQVEQALLQGPVLTGFNATNKFEDFTGTGVFQETTNGSGGVNHAITIIGYDTTMACPDGTHGAYRILNSWGPSWGDSGKAWVAFNSNNIGYACFVLDAKVPNPSPVPSPIPTPTPAPSPVPINPQPISITPNAPDSASVFVSSATSVLIQWRDTNGGGVPYIVYREDWPTFAVSTVATTNPGVVGVWDNKAVAGQTYTYVIRAVSGTTLSGPSNAVTVRTPAQ